MISINDPRVKISERLDDRAVVCVYRGVEFFVMHEFDDGFEGSVDHEDADNCPRVEFWYRYIPEVVDNDYPSDSGLSSIHDATRAFLYTTEVTAKEFIEAAETVFDNCTLLGLRSAVWVANLRAEKETT
jgi:hypothetical protein